MSPWRGWLMKGLVVAVLLGLAALVGRAQEPTSTPSAATPDPFAALLEAAKKEPQKLLLGLGNIQPENRKDIETRFNQRFGLNVKFEWDTTHVIPRLPRLLTEYKAGRHVEDVGFWDVVQYPVILKEAPQMLGEFNWPGTFKSQFPTVDQYVKYAPYAEVAKWALPWNDVVYANVYNTNLIKEADVPRKIEDFSDPKWQGKFGLQAISSSPFHVLSLPHGWGMEKTERVLKSLADNKPYYKRGTPAVLEGLALGEVPVAFVAITAMEILQKQGKPVEFVPLVEMPILTQAITVPVGSQQKSVNLSRLFAAWLILSKEGKEVLWREGTGVTVEKDWPTMQKILKLLPNANFIYPKTFADNELMAQNQNVLYKKYFPGGA